MITIHPTHGVSITRWLLNDEDYVKRIQRITDVIVFTETMRFVRVVRESFDNTYIAANDTIVAIYSDGDNAMTAADMLHAHKYMMSMIADEIGKSLPHYDDMRVFTDAEWQVTGRDY